MELDNRTQSKSRIETANAMKIKIKGHLATLYMVLFQSSFANLCSTHGTLKNFGCNWSAMDAETNSSLVTVTEHTIFSF